MATDRKSGGVSRPARLSWEFPADVPTYEVLWTYDLTDPGDLDQLIDDFVSILERDGFLVWEGVMCREQSLPMTEAQRRAVEKFVSFKGHPSERIFFIEGGPRPSAPWYVTLNAIVPHLLVEPFDTSQMYFDSQHEGWARLMEAVREHAGELSLPDGVESAEDVVPEELRHRLWIQHCIEILGGLGQEGVEPLESDPWRVDEVLLRLREHADSVRHLELTLEGLLERVHMPAGDRETFTRLVSQALGLASTRELLAEKLR